MTDHIALPLPDGRWLLLTREQFAEAEQAAREVLPQAAQSLAGASDELLTADELERRTSVPASWWEQAARENRAPCVRIGRYVRFRFHEVAEHFSRPLDSDSSGAVRAWRKSGS